MKYQDEVNIKKRDERKTKLEWRDGNYTESGRQRRKCGDDQRNKAVADVYETLW